MVKRLLTLLQEGPYGAAFALLAATGMRRGEAVGLTWEDVDFDQQTISIMRAVGRINNHLAFAELKSAMSRRKVHIDSGTLEILRQHRSTQLARIRAINGVYARPDLVFASTVGELLDPDVLTKEWQGVCKRAGVRYRLHDIRHHHAAALIEAGVHINEVQERLGHSSAAFTMQVYAHVTVMASVSV